MRYVLRALSVLGLVLAFCVAPTRVDAQATRPAQDGKILVLPFMAINPAENQAWLGRSIQQSLVSDLTMAAPGRVQSVEQEAPDTPAAVAAGRRADAAFVITGSFTTLNTSAGQGLRLMGQIIDVNVGAPIGAFKSTGMASEIFRLEDQVGNQIHHQLASVGAISPPPVAEAPPSQPQPNQDVAGVYQQPNPYYQEYGTPQAYVPAENNYNYYYGNPGYSGGYYGGYYPYGYGWYGYGWPYWWGGAVIITNGNGHDHDHGHGNGGGHWNGNGGGHWNGGGGGHWGAGGMHMAGAGMHMGGGHMG
ncbi:MAG TPA: hypothetical protein VK797_25675, partial [Tepidisphaeraceae bacterium]|nr:hypothetical protein [Tepidisphaeraceae bacterium]